MRFCAKDHLGESIPFAKALIDAGHEFSPDGPSDLFLIDLDPDKWGYRDVIDFYRDCGAVVLMYPHGAPASTLCYDNLYDPYEGVDGQLTNGTGEIDFFRSIGIERPARAVGWQLCAQFEFRRSEDPKRIVFAPTHVNGDGSLDDDRRAKNGEIFQKLLELPWETELVVRYIGELDRCGLWKDERVFRYVPGNYEITTVEIDASDCVVAGVGTYPCLAVARGVPTVMYGQFRAAMYGERGEEAIPLRNVEKYREIVRYPLDADDSDSLGALIRFACHDNEKTIGDWKRAWIGERFDGPAFAKMVEEWVPELRALREPSLV